MSTPWPGPLPDLPAYPRSRPLVLDDERWYAPRYAQFPAYADLSLANLMVWFAGHHDVGVSLLHDNLVLRSSVPFLEGEESVTLLGDHAMDATLQTIFDHQAEHGVEEQVVGCPAFVAGAATPGRFDVEVDVDNGEYFYAATDWRDLPGPAYRRRRREIARVRRQAGEAAISVAEFASTDAVRLAEVRRALAGWGDVYSHNDPERDERDALHRLFDLAPRLGHRVLTVAVDGELQAFAAYQVLTHADVALVNHVKVASRWPLLNSYLLSAVAEAALEQGVTTLNFEQDLGLAGLRAFKQSLHPRGVLAKHTIRPRLT